VSPRARYRIVPEESVAWIEARSSLHPIHSETRGLTGFFEAEVQGDGRVNLTAPVAGRVELPVERLSSGNPLYDREMKRRVDARRFPVISGELTSMSESGRDGLYRMEGDVTFKGATRRVADEMAVSAPGEGVVHLEGEHVFDVRDFGMEPPKILMLKVDPEVTVKVRIAARREG
jgi:polyisoprenoid-binding protein YceI